MSLLAQSSNKSEVYEKVCNFIKMKQWEISLSDVNLWLSNFAGDDLGEYFAYRLLDNFIFYTSNEIKFMCKRLLRLIKRQLLVDQFKINKHILNEQELDQLFSRVYSKSLFTYVTGEKPNPTDSGCLMCRYYREIGIPENKIVHPYEVPGRLLNDCDNVFFIDDLIGSGLQMTTFWYRPQFNPVFSALFGPSFVDLSESFQDVNFYYLVLAGTSSGMDHVNINCPRLKVIFGEHFTDEYGTFEAKSMFWSDEKERRQFIDYYEKWCNRVGISDDQIKRGIGGLGLTIAFSHGIPDNALPIFWWAENGWRPLIRRGV